MWRQPLSVQLLPCEAIREQCSILELCPSCLYHGLFECFNIYIAWAWRHYLWIGPHLMVCGGGGAHDLWHKSKMLPYDKEAVSSWSSAFVDCRQTVYYWPVAAGNVALCLNTPLQWLPLVISISLLYFGHYIRTYTFSTHWHLFLSRCWQKYFLFWFLLFIRAKQWNRITNQFDSQALDYFFIQF